MEFACCGHDGELGGYVKFNNGRVMRGFFKHNSFLSEGLGMYSKLKTELVKAMKTNDVLRKMVIRNVIVQIEKKQQEKVLRDKPEDAAASKKERPSDEMVAAAVRKELKELSKAVKEFPEGHKLIGEYKAQIDVCYDFLPSIELDTEAIAAAVDASIAALADTESKTPEIKVGVVIGHVMRNNKGFPGAEVKRIVSEKLVVEDVAE